MLSAFILAVHSYSALHLAAQQIHQRYVRPGPLVLRSRPLNLLTPTTDRDRTVLRRSEPSSRATLIGEQPNPWDLLQPLHAEPPDHFSRLSSLLDLYVSQSSSLILMRSTYDYQPY
jgi:hypothetical protein